MPPEIRPARTSSLHATSPVTGLITPPMIPDIPKTRPLKRSKIDDDIPMITPPTNAATYGFNLSPP